MKIAIYGAARMGLEVYIKIIEKKQYNIVCFIDKNPGLQGTFVGNTPVISFEQFVRDYKEIVDAVFITMLDDRQKTFVKDQLLLCGIKKYAYCHYSYYGDKDVDILWVDSTKQPITLCQLGFNVSDECNLNCKACGNFSPLFKPDESYYDFEEFKHDITEISNNVFVHRLLILGGEPLLNNNLFEYIDFARFVFPQTEIAIVTNGLLVLKQSDKLFETMKRCNVGFRISPYKPTMKLRDKITEYLLSKNVKFTFFTQNNSTGQIDTFQTLLSNDNEPNSNPYKIMLKCGASLCSTIKNGKLYKCAQESNIYKYINVYGVKNDLNTDDFGIDIYNIKDWKKVIEEFINNPVNLCRYCSEKRKNQKWEQCTTVNPPLKSDWIT